MPTLDSQVHAYERNHPGRPWVGILHGPAEVTGDQMVAAMDAVGVDGAVLVSPFSACIATTPATPSKFTRRIPTGSGWSSRSIRPIPPWPIRSPTGRPPRARSASGSCCETTFRPTPPTPAINRVLAAAAQHSLPVNLLCSGRLEQAAQLAARNPNTRLVIDHLGLQQPFEPPPPAEPFADLPKAAGAGGPRQHRDQNQRRLHAVARTLPLQRHLGSARPHLRRLWLRSLHVGHRLDPSGRIVDLRAGGRGVSRHRPPVRQRPGRAHG